MRLIGRSVGILGLVCCLSVPAQAKHRPSHHSTPTYNKEDIINAINGAVRQIDPDAVIGIKVKSMRDRDVLYTLNESQPFIPASIMKVLTAEAAFLFLGPNYKFSTSMLTSSESATNGVINGDVYLVHSGDPSLTYNDITDLVLALKSQQIQKIKGNVYIDNFAFDQANYGPGWVWNDTQFCFSAPINASIINHNCLPFKIAPAKLAGRRANLILSPRYYYEGIENTVKTKSRWSRSCYVRLNPEKNNVISVTGCLPQGSYSRGGSIVINDIIQYNKSLLHNLFKRYAITVKGKYGVKPAPTNLYVLATHDSKPLNVLVNDMLKNSDNIIAGALFKKMGQLYYNKPGSWQNSKAAVNNILSQHAGIQTAQLRIIDGSGLSHTNQVTPQEMMQALDYAYHDDATSYEFISALPISGVDGTLKHRLKNIMGRVRAKTGTIAGVVSLAGYVTDKDRETIAFVIMINGRTGNIWKYREIEDQIVTALANFSRKS